MKKTKKKIIPKARQYKEGYFVEPNQYAFGADTTSSDDATSGGLANWATTNVGAVNSGAQLAASGVNMLQPVNGDTNAGMSALSGGLSGAGTGAKLGSAFGPEGTLIGAGVGLVGGAVAGLISGGKKHAAYERQQLQNTQNSYFSTRGNMQSQNIDPYGSQMAFGDTVPDTNNPGGAKYSPRDYTINYTNSPMYKQRLASTGQGTKPQGVEDLYNTQFSYNKNADTQAFPKYPGNSSVNRININQDQINKLGANQDEVQAHEFSHLARKISPNEQSMIFGLNKSPDAKTISGLYNGQGDLNHFINGYNNNQYHNIRPDESKADLDALRYQMYKKGIYDTSKGDLDQDTLNKALKDPEINNSVTTKRLLQNFDPKSIVQMNNTIASTSVSNSNPTNSDSYANGASVGLSGQAAGKFYVPNAGLRRFAPHMQRVGKPNPLPSNNLDLKDPNTQVMEMGDRVQDTPTNSQQNMINIQKGELLIDPNKGNILQEYNGINPLTGGLFQPHAKDKSQESPNNFTMADPGLFVITKKTAKQYKDAVDNNDKISQKTVLMNIRNAKIQKEGGLQPVGAIQPPQGNYAYGDEIMPYGQYSNNLGLPNASIAMPRDPAMPNNTLRSDVNNQINNTVVPTNSLQVPSNGGNQSTFSKVGDALTNYGPSLYNIGQGLFGSAQHQAYVTPTTNPYASNVIANMPKNVNMQPITNDIYSNQELANKNLEGQTNSSSVYRANRQALASNTNRALSDARLKASEINNQAAGQRAYMYNALGYQNQQEQGKVRDLNLGIDEMNNRATAAKQNLLNAGLSQLQQTTQNEKANKQKQGMDKYSLELLAQTFPNSKFYNQFQIDYVNKLLGR